MKRSFDHFQAALWYEDEARRYTALSTAAGHPRLRTSYAELATLHRQEANLHLAFAVENERGPG